MRMLMRVEMDTQAANQAYESGVMGRDIESLVERAKPESAYFCTEDGMRTAYLFFDMSEPSQMPVLAEPLFQDFNAKVDWRPVMDLNDLRAGLEQATKNR